MLYSIISYKELFAKIAPEVWAHLSFLSKMTLLYQITPTFVTFFHFHPNH
ncbi:hypothetical protein HanPI659440_Chr15g0575731 [Helianthus annuus]|nr:hypothetical protein HanPI659440_Chr15g0575731 [Helianthus annuus]